MKTLAAPIRPIDPDAELALHVLAHVASGVSAGDEPDVAILKRAASVFEPRYVAFARAAFPSGACAWIDRDRELLGRLWARATPSEIARVAALPFVAKGQLDRSTRSALVDPVGDAPPAVLCELVLCDMQLSREGFRRAHEDVIGPELARACQQVRETMAEARDVAPALGRFDIELSFVLGPRGRTSGTRISVGAPAAWNRLDPGWAAMMSLHECAVALAGGEPASSSYRTAEALALRAVGRLDLPERLMGLHESWRAAIEPLGLGEPSASEIDRVAHALATAGAPPGG